MGYMQRTLSVNNNVYCQDNEIRWFDWSLRDRHADIHRLKCLSIRRNHACDYASGEGMNYR